jgi:hypothetical protein
MTHDRTVATSLTASHFISKNTVVVFVFVVVVVAVVVVIVVITIAINCSQGEHMHHGYYPTPEYADHQQAQVDMIDNALSWAFGKTPATLDEASGRFVFKKPQTMVDVGCGVGGSSRHIARKWGTKAKGVLNKERLICCDRSDRKKL